MLSERQIDIVAYLSNQENRVSSEQLSNHFGLSKKTLQTELAEIEKQVGRDGKVDYNKNGYRLEYLSETMRKTICEDIELHGGKSSLGIRTSTFILYLLFQTDYVSMQQLADIFFFSKTAVSMEITTIRRWIERYDGLDLEVSKTKGIIVRAAESRKRAYCAKFGTLYAFRNLSMGETFGETYQRYLAAAQKAIIDLQNNYCSTLTGEAMRKNSRFLACSILRSTMGYEREPSEKKPDPRMEPLRTMIKKELTYSMSDAELWDVQRMLWESATLEESSSFPIYRETWVQDRMDVLESRLCDILNLREGPLFAEREQVVRHLSKMQLRYEAGNVAVNHYNEEIVRRYPLEAHLMYRLVPEVFGGRVTKETSFMALFLGTGLNAYRDRRSVLLVSNQNQSVISQIKAAIRLCGTPQIGKIDVLPGYALEQACLDDYDILLTTDQETLLTDERFFQIPSVLTHGDVERLDVFLKHRAKKLREDKRQAIRQTCLRVMPEPRETDSIDQIIGSPRDAYQSYHSLENRKLFICRVAPSETDSIQVWHLQKPAAFQYKKIQDIIFARFPKGGEGALDFFDTVRSVIEET